MADLLGTPDANVKLNDSAGPGGNLYVKSGGATYFPGGETGVVTLTEKLLRVGTHVMDVGVGGPANDMLYLAQSATTRMEFARNSSSTYARVKATTSGDALRLEGDTVQLNTPNSTGTITTFRVNGTSVATVEYDSTGVAATLKSGNNLIVKTDETLTLHFGASTGVVRALNFQHTASSGTPYNVASVAESGTWDFNDGTTGAREAQLSPSTGGGTPDCALALGQVAVTRGYLEVLADSTTPRSGVIRLGTQDAVNGLDLYLFAYYDSAAPVGQRNQLRCYNADPGGANVGAVIARF